MKKAFISILIAALFAACAPTDTENPEPRNTFKVIEYLPAPGQFINESPAFDGVDTPEKAASYAQERLDKGYFVSLGAFGGYIVVGFAEPIANSGGDDFAIGGNQTPTSSEPGIVWVMADANGNGLADDIWYELRGSEPDNAVKRDYTVTYRRPAAGEGVEWTGSDGAGGIIERNSFHKQGSYYPAWIAEDEYELTGTLLESRTARDETTGEWTNAPFGWGYADNLGSDLGEGSEKNRVRFKISNAIGADGNPVDLPSIDFVKVQTGVQAMAGPLGEVSTEVTGFFRVD